MKILMLSLTIMLRINRYIVGCKFFGEYGVLAGRAGINRYIVGCKYRRIRFLHSSVWELIDT